MIKTWIPSLNRAAQLEALLDSIEKFCPNLFDVTVCAMATSYDFWMGYGELKWKIMGGRYSFPVKVKSQPFCPARYLELPPVDIDQDTSFHTHFRAVVDPTDLFHLITDDSVFFRSLPENAEEIIRHEMKWDAIQAFSLRLGLNTTTQCYWTGEKTADLAFNDHNPCIVWNYRAHPKLDNYSYLPACDGYVFRGVDVLEWLDARPYKNLREFEGFMSQPKEQWRLKRNCMASFKESVLTNVSVNAVTGDNAVPCGFTHPLSVEEINTKYLDGYSMRYEINPDEVHGCHMECPITFFKEN